MSSKTETTIGDAADTSKLHAQIEALRAEIAQMGATISLLMSEKTSSIGAKVAHGVEKAAAQAGDLTAASLENLSATTSKIKDDAIDTIAAEVRNNPLRTLAIALGAGLVIGLWSAKR